MRLLPASDQPSSPFHCRRRLNNALLGDIAVAMNEGGWKEFPCSGGKEDNSVPRKNSPRGEVDRGKSLHSNFLETIPPATLSMLDYTVIHGDADKHTLS